MNSNATSFPSQSSRRERLALNRKPSNSPATPFGRWTSFLLSSFLLGAFSLSLFAVPPQTNGEELNSESVNAPTAISSASRSNALPNATIATSSPQQDGAFSETRSDPSSPSDETVPNSLTRSTSLPEEKFSDGLRHAIELTRSGEFETSLQEFRKLEASPILSTLSQSENYSNAVAYWFYRAIAEHQTFLKKDCEISLDKLGELSEMSSQFQTTSTQAPSFPTRFKVLADLMRRDLESLQEESLEMISRKMKSVERRLDSGAVGQKIQASEEEIVEMLDSMIDEIEQKAQMQKSQAGRALKSGKPMEKAQIAGGAGPGKVAPKELKFDRNWGNLPEKEREAVLQQLGRDFPPHYRQVIEQYFRKIAEEE